MVDQLWLWILDESSWNQDEMLAQYTY